MASRAKRRTPKTVTVLWDGDAPDVALESLTAAAAWARRRGRSIVFCKGRLFVGADPDPPNFAEDVGTVAEIHSEEIPLVPAMWRRLGAAAADSFWIGGVRVIRRAMVRPHVTDFLQRVQADLDDGRSPVDRLGSRSARDRAELEADEGFVEAFESLGGVVLTPRSRTVAEQVRASLKERGVDPRRPQTLRREDDYNHARWWSSASQCADLSRGARGLVGRMMKAPEGAAVEGSTQHVLEIIAVARGLDGWRGNFLDSEPIQPFSTHGLNLT